MMRNAQLPEQAEKYQAVYTGGDIDDKTLDGQTCGAPGDAFSGLDEARDPSHIDLEDSGDSSDPVVAQYSVFVNYQVKEQIHLVQYVNRDGNQPYSEAGNAKPLEL